MCTVGVKPKIVTPLFLTLAGLYLSIEAILQVYSNNISS